MDFKKSCFIEQSHCLERSFDWELHLSFFWDLTKKWCFCLKFKVHYLYHISLTRVSQKDNPRHLQKNMAIPLATGHGFLPLSGAILGLDVCIRKPLDTRPLASAFGGRGRNPKKGRPSKDVWPYDAYMIICWLYIYTCIYALAYICHFKCHMMPIWLYATKLADMCGMCDMPLAKWSVKGPQI